MRCEVSVTVRFEEHHPALRALLVLVLELVDEKGAQVTAVRSSLGVFPVQRLNAWVNALTS